MNRKPRAVNVNIVVGDIFAQWTPTSVEVTGN